MGWYEEIQIITSNDTFKNFLSWENIFGNDTSDTGLISKIYKEFTWLHSRKTKKKTIKKWAKDLNRHFSKEDTEGPETYEKMLSIISHQRDANWNHNEISLHISENGHHNQIHNNKCWRGCGEKGTTVHCWWECRLVQPLWNFHKKLKMELPF